MRSARAFVPSLCLLFVLPLAQAGEPTVFAGDLKTPFSLDFTKDGTAYGVEYEEGNRVFAISPDGELRFVAGQKLSGGKKLGDVAVDGPAAKARFNGMHDIAIHPGGNRIFLADTFNHRVRFLDLVEKTVSTFAGRGGKGGFSGDGGPAAEADFKEPHTVALNPRGTHLLVADLGNLRIREIDLSTGIIRTVAGNGKKGMPEDGTPATEAPLLSPRAACYTADGQGFYIASRNGHAVRLVRPDGTLHTIVGVSGKAGYAGDGGPGEKAQVNGPKHVALGRTGSLVITDDNNHCLRLYDPKTGMISLLAGIPQKKGTALGDGPLQTELNRPHGARYDANGRLWIADSFNHRVLRFE